MSSIIIMFICALLAMAFFTLLERKILGYIQLRKGPNKVSIMGIPQPMADALKLFTKESSIPMNANMLVFISAPMLGLFLALILWIIYPYKSSPFLMKWSIMLFLCVSSMNVYTTLLSGWSSNSKYSLIGSLRSIAQTISYEISMSLVILSPMIMISSLSFNMFYKMGSMSFIMLMWPLVLMWFITSLAETNRTPFDLSEGESELVSGFNTEYSSGSFALIFMAEYMNIIIMSLITVCFFMLIPMNYLISDMYMVIMLSMISMLFIYARGTYPRIRYDKLMSLTWKQFLPMTLWYIMIIMFITV
uniref:NADH-ubiquinone oxidoreductase chain 1 n=1 Tax=Laeonereis culveri TaxID=1859080 RepID=A0A1B0ZF17_9ANNE|nr:NADH dehydrogenase subunit 1 [Laeonereis culveri]